MIMDFSSEAVEARRKCHKISEVLKEKTINPEPCIQQKYPLGMKGKTTHFKIKEN